MSYATDIKPITDAIEKVWHTRLTTICEELDLPIETTQAILDMNKNFTKNISVGKRSRKKRDPDLPKRPGTAYLFFSKNIHTELKCTHPDATTQDLMRLKSVAWREITPKIKLKFERLAEKDRKRYEMEMDKYKETHE